jgi:hypothetical protein
MNRIAVVAILVAALGAFDCLAKDPPKADAFTTALSAVPAAELPARAAKLVKSAKGRDRETTTIAVVRAAVRLNPGAAAPVVGAIARAVPAMADVAAGAAATEAPRYASAIAKAAVGGAPVQAGKIVAAVCRAVPSDYRRVAVAASEAAPSSAKEILTSVATAVPELMSYIDRELARYGLMVPSVTDTLDRAQATLTRVTQAVAAQGNPGRTASSRGVSATPPAASPHGAPSAPPSIPPSPPNPNNARPTPTGGDTTSGGRNYSRP